MDDLLCLRSLQRLHFEDCAIEPELVRRLDELPWLHALTINGENIGNAEAKSIGMVSSLMALDVSYSNILDTGVRSLSNLKRIESLNLSGTPISRQSLQIVWRWPNFAD